MHIYICIHIFECIYTYLHYLPSYLSAYLPIYLPIYLFTCLPSQVGTDVTPPVSIEALDLGMNRVMLFSDTLTAVDQIALFLVQTL